MGLHRIVYLLAVLTTVLCTKNRFRKEMKHYPPDTPFWVTDYFTKGCRVFIDLCPSVYKIQPICGQNYNKEFKNFANYCEMQFENCNTWLNWHVFKRERC